MKLKVDIKKDSAVPIYAQLQNQIRLQIHRGALRPGEAMPTVRALAVDLGVNANTVARVYRDLQNQGLLRLERGVGTFVTEGEGDRGLAEDAYQTISEKASELVELSRQAGLRAGEVTQLVETLWKEKTDAQR